MMDLRTIQHSILIGRHRIIVNNLNKKRSKVLFQLYIAPFLKFQLWDATMLIVDTDTYSIKPIFLHPLFFGLRSYYIKIMDLLLIIWYNLMVRA